MPDPSWLERPRWQYIRDYDVYEPATGTASKPLVILIHDAGGNRRELGPLARHLARHGVRALVPAIDYDDPNPYAVVDELGMHRLAAQPAGGSTIFVGHGAGGYVAARLSVQSNPAVIGSVVLAPALPPGIGSASIGYAGDDRTRMVQLDVGRETGRCTANGSETTFHMIRNYRTRAELPGATYCSVLGDAGCAARCGGTHEPADSTAAFEAVARVVAAWTSNRDVAETDLLAAVPTTKGIQQKAGDVGSEDWAMPSLFWELGGAARDDTLRGVRGALGIRLDYHPVPNVSSKRVPTFARRYRAKRWGLGGYGEVAWQHDDLSLDDLRLGAGFALARATGSSHVALGLGANLLLGQHGVTVGADATLNISPFFALRIGTTREDSFAIHGSIMVIVPASVVAILIPLLM